jgi:hypothetical protein
LQLEIQFSHPRTEAMKAARLLQINIPQVGDTQLV